MQRKITARKEGTYMEKMIEKILSFIKASKNLIVGKHKLCKILALFFMILFMTIVRHDIYIKLKSDKFELLKKLEF